MVLLRSILGPSVLMVESSLRAEQHLLFLQLRASPRVKFSVGVHGMKGWMTERRTHRSADP